MKINSIMNTNFASVKQNNNYRKTSIPQNDTVSFSSKQKAKDSDNGLYRMALAKSLTYSLKKSKETDAVLKGEEDTKAAAQLLEEAQKVMKIAHKGSGNSHHISIEKSNSEKYDYVIAEKDPNSSRVKKHIHVKEEDHSTPSKIYICSYDTKESLYVVDGKPLMYCAGCDDFGKADNVLTTVRAEKRRIFNKDGSTKEYVQKTTTPYYDKDGRVRVTNQEINQYIFSPDEIFYLDQNIKSRYDENQRFGSSPLSKSIRNVKCIIRNGKLAIYKEESEKYDKIGQSHQLPHYGLSSYSTKLFNYNSKGMPISVTGSKS